MKIALLTTDSREHFKDYMRDTPYFGTAPAALLEGFGMLGQKVQNQQPGEAHQAPFCFEIHVISCSQSEMPAPEKLAGNVWFHPLHVPKSGWLRSGYSGCVRAVRHRLREIQPDIVHAQGTERDCAISAVFSPYPKVLTIHGNLRLIRSQVGFRPFSALWIQSLLEGWVVPKFDGVVCITNYTREAVEKEVPRTWVVPNAVDPMFLALGEKRIGERAGSESPSQHRVQEPPPVILCVGNIDERKNQLSLIEALDPLSRERAFEVRFFGALHEGNYGKRFLESVNDRPWCRYGGMIGRAELAREFESASLLILPTFEDNCPMVVLEAMAAGVPVVASRVGGIPDLIRDRETGLFCDPRDPVSMRECVGRLLENREEATAMARAALEEARRRFHPEVIARRHLEIYRDVLGR